jgi:hypothetical protein
MMLISAHKVLLGAVKIRNLWSNKIFDRNSKAFQALEVYDSGCAHVRPEIVPESGEIK